MTSSSVLPKDTIAIDGGANSATFAIDRTYTEGGSYQWAVELLRNIIQVFLRMTAAGNAAANKVGAFFDFVIIEILDQNSGAVLKETYKRCVWNIGTPMDKTELFDIYSKLNIGGGEDRWSLKNLNGSYGVGARAATLPFTDLLVTTVIPGDGVYGVVLGGTEIARPDGSTETLYTIKRGVNYFEDGAFSIADPLVRLAAVDASGEALEEEDVVYLRTGHGTEIALTQALVPAELRDSEVGGVSFLFLGKGDYLEPTEFDAMPWKKESGRPTPISLTNRFVGGVVPVVCRYMYTHRAATGARIHSSKMVAKSGEEFFYDQRTLKTLEDWTNRGIALAPVYLDAHGTTATAYLLPEDHWHDGSYTAAQVEAEENTGSKDTFEYRADGTWGRVKGGDEWLPFRGQGTVVVQYGDHEMYALKEGIDRSSDVLKRWGISDERVARSVLIVVKPPVQASIHDDGWGITQNAARSNITGPNGSELPIGDWQSSWLDNFPKEILERLQIRPPSHSRDIPAEDIKRLENRAFGPKAKVLPKSDPIVVIATGKEKVTTEGEEADGTSPTSAGSGRGKPKPKPGLPSSKDSTHATEKEGGSKRVTKRRPKRPEPPQPKFLTATEWAKEGHDPEQFCRVSLEGGGYKIELNSGHEVMNRQVAYYWDDLVNGHFSKPTTRKVRDKILRKFGGVRTAGADAKAKTAAIEEIQYVYRFDAMATFIGAEAVFTDAAGSLDEQRFKDHIVDDSMSMTVSLSAYYPQAEAIKSRLNGLAS